MLDVSPNKTSSVLCPPRVGDLGKESLTFRRGCRPRLCARTDKRGAFSDIYETNLLIKRYSLKGLSTRSSSKEDRVCPRYGCLRVPFIRELHLALSLVPIFLTYVHLQT